MKYACTSIFVIITLLSSIVSKAQPTNRKDSIIDAQYYFLNDEYAAALKLFRQLATREPNNANLNYLTGLCYLKLPFENGRSIPFLRKAVNDVSKKYREGSHRETKAPYNALYWLGFALHNNKYFDEASKYYSL